MAFPGSPRARLSTMAAALAGMVAFAPPASSAAAYRYDGSWSLSFVTRTGGCDPGYNFTVNVNRGIISHPNLVRFTGRVTRSGATRASVRVGDKFASGSGRLSGVTGSGRWAGYSGASRCAGTWTAQRN